MRPATEAPRAPISEPLSSNQLPQSRSIRSSEREIPDSEDDEDHYQKPDSPVSNHRVGKPQADIQVQESIEEVKIMNSRNDDEVEVKKEGNQIAKPHHDRNLELSAVPHSPSDSSTTTSNPQHNNDTPRQEASSTTQTQTEPSPPPSAVTPHSTTLSTLQSLPPVIARTSPPLSSKPIFSPAHARLTSQIAALTSQRTTLETQLATTQALLPDPMVTAETIVKSHIARLQRYNEIRDVAMGLMGLIAEGRGVRLAVVLEEFGVGGCFDDGVERNRKGKS